MKNIATPHTPALKKTKIVATIGPATEKEPEFTELVKAGLNVMRLNFSHGDHPEHQARVEVCKKVSEKLGVHMAILQDLSGPKIRIGDFGTESGRVTLKAGQKFTITTDKVIGTEEKVSVNYPTLPQELKVGGFVLLDDGKKRLQVTEIKGNDIHCKVIVGGDTKGRRGVNLPGAYLKISSITDKDRKDLEFGIKNKVDYIALSFVRRPEDITELRGMLDKAKSKAKIIAKIETEEAIDNLEAIVALTDGVMVARGDLAIEVPAEKVPMIQKRLIAMCNEQGKPVITATQMLESMIKSPVPTRAEVSDIANAILDGTDAIMLSEETTLGEYPVEAIKVMSRVAAEIEAQYPIRTVEEVMTDEKNVVDAVSGAVIHIATQLDAKAIIAVTHSGLTARMLSRFKPAQHIYALTPDPKVATQLVLTAGVTPVLVEKRASAVDTFESVKKVMIKNKMITKGDVVVLAAGLPFDKNIDTNALIVETI
ncbi:MAG TPA: pyruvate kinase [Candidatus Paceibacterota bacterium]|nr:pyruvate kinase [Candidatus Paceibacterota bacterium]